MGEEENMHGLKSVLIGDKKKKRQKNENKKTKKKKKILIHVVPITNNTEHPMGRRMGKEEKIHGL